MKLEHLALNVPDPAAMARWYAANLGMTVVRSWDTAPFGHFLAESAGSVMIELYHNPLAPVLDFAALAAPTLHVAFLSEDVVTDRARLLAAGASECGAVDYSPNGDVIAVVRDPWGLAVQLVQRAAPMR